MKRILLYTVCGLAMLTMFNSCHIYNKYHRHRVDDIYYICGSY